jgi:hypothetical protein
VISGDILIATPPSNKSEGTFRFRGLKLTDNGAQELWQAAPLLFDENIPVTIAGNRAYFLGRHTGPVRMPGWGWSANGSCSFPKANTEPRTYASSTEI